jgi:glycosyltransferase involved in cell wall biosynthesis
MNTPKISVITSTFNSGKTLLETINSILNQSYSNIEYIIVDGNSKDNTVEILKNSEDRFVKKGIEFKWISELDTGIYNAWNKALKMVEGDWLVFIGSDDYFKSNTIFEEMIPFLNQSEKNNCNYVYGQIEHVNEKGERIELAGKPWSQQKERFTYTMNIGHSGCFHHKNLFINHGEFNDSFKIAGDYEFLLREFKDKSKKALFVEKILIVMREGGVSATLRNRLLLVKENYKARRLNNITSFSKELFYWEIRVRFILLISKIFGNKTAAKIADIYRIILGKEKRWSE